MSEPYTSGDFTRTQSNATDRDSVKFNNHGATAPESMDFEEMETVMWRKVRCSYKMLTLTETKSIDICCIYCASASITKILSGPWPMVD